MNSQTSFIKTIIYRATLGLIFLLPLQTMAQDMAENPIIRTDRDGNRIYTADPSAHVWEDGRLYIYASQDIDPPQGCDRMDQYHVFSTDDMLNWVDHGEILRASDVPWGREEGGFMWAPDCAYKNGKYYFFFPHPSESDANSSWKIGVAVSDEPAANFKVHPEYIKTKDADGNLGELKSLIDPCVFVDDDGKAYLIHGGGDCWMGELNDDMLTVKAETYQQVTSHKQTNPVLEDCHEGTWLFKRDGIYYIAYADNNPHYNRQRYAMSRESVWGPWENKGVFLDETTTETSHGSVVEYKGQWYAFYHNDVLSHHLKPNGALRSVCVDKLYFNEDGTIQRVIQTGMDITINRRGIPDIIEAEDFGNGGPGVSFYDKTPTNEGNFYRRAGVDIERCTDVGYNVFNTEDGEWLKYDIQVKNTNTYRMELRVASSEGGAIRVNIGDYDSGRIDIPATGGEQVWKSFFVYGIPLVQGEYEMLVTIEKGGVNIDNYMFVFDQSIPYGAVVTLQSENKYMTYRGNAWKDMMCNISARDVTEEEYFTVVKVDENIVALKGKNGCYVTAHGENAMKCEERTITERAKFVWCPTGYRSMVLRSLYDNNIVCGENGEKAMRCNRREVGSWETFIVRIIEDPSSLENTYLNRTKLTVYPSADKKEIILGIELDSPSDASIVVMDLQGNVIRQYINFFGENFSEQTINIEGISAGLYLLRVVTAEFDEVKKVII